MSIKEIQNEFEKELNEQIKKQIKKLNEFIFDHELKIQSVNFAVEPVEDILTKYGLNNDISFTAKYTVDGVNVKFKFKHMELEPDCYYIRPDDYHDVTVLEILKECIIQNTHTPDIKFLERGEKQNNAQQI